ncbi:MAG: hypothetical protein O3B31_06470 [Chloroflexi bacterium]|nr:hypothetical protein [Chloroflexota bacterium]
MVRFAVTQLAARAPSGALTRRFALLLFAAALAIAPLAAGAAPAAAQSAGAETHAEQLCGW